MRDHRRVKPHRVSRRGAASTLVRTELDGKGAAGVLEAMAPDVLAQRHRRARRHRRR